MKKITLLFFVCIFSVLSWQTYGQSTIEITTSGGLYPGEKWVSITTAVDGGGTQVWGQGNGTQCDGSGLLTNEVVMLAPGTYYVNCYDQYDDSWDGTLISVTAYGNVIGNNGGVSPDDGSDTDTSSACEGTAEELEASFLIVVPAPPSCPPVSGVTSTPSSLTETTITWTPGGGEMGWTYEWGVSGFTPGSGTQGNVMTTPSLDLTGLTAGESYDIYITAFCNPDSSTAVGPITWTQPTPGSSCATAFSITLEADCSTATPLTVDYANSTDIGPFSCDGTIGNNGFWFDFTSGASGAVRFQVEGTTNEYAIFDACGGTELICGGINGSLTLSGLAANTNYKMAIWRDGATSGTSDICFEEVSCLFPTALTLDSVSTTTAQISWTAGGTETEWEYVLQAPGTGVPTGSGTVTTTNPLTLTMLISATDYELYLRANCGGSLGSSAWSGPLTFSTDCEVFTPDYNTDFSTFLPDCWDEASNGDAVSGPTDIGSGNWSQSGSLARINLYSDFNSDWLLTPEFDLSAGGLELVIEASGQDFGAAAGNFSGMGSDDVVEILITTDGGTTWTAIYTFDATTNPLATTATDVTIDLSAYTGSSNQFGIRGSDGTVNDTEDYYANIHSFEIRTPLSCAEPSMLSASNITGTSADLAWIENGSATLWDVELVDITAGGIQTMTPTASGVTNPYAVTGLTGSNDYEFYVRADCGGGDISPWVGPFAFSTLCAVVSPPYSTDFTVFLPNCWDEASNGDATTGPTDVGSGNWSQSGSLARINLYSDFNSYWLLTPEFDLSSGGLELVVEASGQDFGSAAGNFSGMGSDDVVEVLVSTDGGITWSVIYTFNQANPLLSSATNQIIDLSAYSGSSNLFGIRGSDGTVNDAEDYYVNIHSFTVRPQAPSNDECANAEIIETADFGTTISGSNVGATDSGMVDACVTGGDVWYSFTTDADGGDINVTIDPGFEYAFYSDCSGTLVGSCNSALSGAVASTTYYLRIGDDGTTRRAPGAFNFSVSGSALSVDGFDDQISFAYYPNPVNDKLTLEAQQNIEQVSMYNMLGQEVMRIAPNTINTDVDMSGLAQGAYFVKVSIAGTLKTIRVIKQ